MGYTTSFSGSITVEPPMSEELVTFLTKFARTRRMHTKHGPYYVDNPGFMGQDHTPDVIDFNSPPPGQPGLWCQWVPTSPATVEWDWGEKFYNSPEWMKYLIGHFLAPKGHTCNGEIEAQGEDPSDRWTLIVKDNVVMVADYVAHRSIAHEI